MLVRKPYLSLLLCLSAAISCFAWDIYPADPLVANGRIASSPAKQALAGMPGAPCQLPTIGPMLDLPTAEEHALCANPKTRQAWANVKVQAAQLGESRAAYWPTLSASLEAIRDRDRLFVKNNAFFNEDNRLRYRTQTLTLSWLLYDFGARSAAVDEANRLLDAANASQDAAIQDVLLTTARDYYLATAAAATLASTQQIETSAQSSLTAATERVKGGVAPVTDQLQAQTAYAQAVYNRTKAQGDQATALGTLALDMGLSPDTPLALAEPAEQAMPSALSSEMVSQLLADAAHSHPSLLAARAQLDAAQAKVKQVRAQGLPSLTLTGRMSHNNQPTNPGIGQQDLPATNHDRFVGVQLDIPLFEGFNRTYQIRQAEAQAEVQRTAVMDAEQQVALKVWQSYQALQTEVENVHNSEVLLDSAKLSFEAAQHRYERGVGNILELLNAQTAYANAQQQRVQALAEWRVGKLQLVGSLGRLSTADH